MNKSSLASVATLLLWVGVTLGQGQETPTTLPQPRIQGPSGPALIPGHEAPTPQPSPTIPERPVPWTLWGEVQSCFDESRPANASVVTADLEYVLWFLANSSDNGTVASTDILSSNRARVLGNIGDPEHAREPGSGARLALGYWAIRDNPWVPGGIRDLGAEAVFFFVGQRSLTFTDDTSPRIVRPFFDLNNRRESGFVVAAPGLATGGLTAHAQANVWGAEANVWKNVYCEEPGTTCSVNVMVGFRFLDLDEQLTIDSLSVFQHNLAAFPAFLPFAGNTLQVGDSFAAHNRFYGAQVGIVGTSAPAECLLLECAFKIGVGDTVEDLEIAGSQVRTRANSRRTVTPAGLLALPSNSGHFHKDQFAEVPELDLKMSVPLTSHLTFFTGFSTLYWSRILRPGEQIERGLNVNQIPNFPQGASAPPIGLSQPGVPFKQSDLWVLGINVGLEIKF
jgi:hypothetical protein